MKHRTTECWKQRVGEQGVSVTVCERQPGGILYARAFDPTLRGGRGDYRYTSLKHRDHDKAITYAHEQVAKLRQGVAVLVPGTLARVFALYEKHRTPRKSAGEQSEDKRRVELWTRVLGARKDPDKISLGEWEAFQDARRSGATNGRGLPVPEDDREPVRQRTVEADCTWLRQVLGWAVRWRGSDGEYLLRDNPVRGFAVDEEKNPRRPVASTDRYEAIRKVSDRVLMEDRVDGHRRTRRSYLSEILDLVHGTGRRISAILALRFEDLHLERTKTRPHGAIRWPGETDKEGQEWWAPISATVRKVLERVLSERPGIGAAYIFPSPLDPTCPVRYELASAWLLEGEGLAKVAKHRGSLWHAYRRGWATSRKHLPVADVAAAGGWKNVATLQTCYQQPDDATLLTVVEGGRELREAR